jgi:hypothetical protein
VRRVIEVAEVMRRERGQVSCKKKMFLMFLSRANIAFARRGTVRLGCGGPGGKGA